MSGNFSSRLLGLIAVLSCLLLLKEVTLPLHSRLQPISDSQSADTSIQWQFPELPESKHKPTYVESNPNVPENSPEPTRRFSFRDQQAAQPVVGKITAIQDSPKIEGIENNPKIIEAAKSSEKQLPTRNPPLNILKKLEKKSPISRKLISSKADVPDSEDDSGFYSKKNPVEGNEDASIIVASREQSNLDSPKTNRIPSETLPRKRPRLSPDLIRGPLMKSITNAPRIGEIAIECQLHPYGVYIQEMLQSIEEQWNQLTMGSAQYLRRDRLPGKVTLKFKLEANGMISNLARVDNEGYSLAAELCRQAVASRVPFGVWTDKMKKDFGQSDEITLSFQYQ